VSTPGSGVPQFGTAEYKSTGEQICAGCKKPLSGSYFRINDSLACDWCTQQIKMRSPQDSHSIFVRAILFGIGGAVAGMVLYSTFTILTGIIIGYVSLAVGWLVGTAMKKGSQGVGGRRYQIAAVALTYSAVSLSAIPIGISFYLKDKKPAAHASSNPTNSSPSATSSDTPNGEVVDIPETSTTKPKPAAGALIATLLFAGLASPFLELSSGLSGIIGLVILFVGIRIAWKITSAPPLEILGPFQAGAPTAPPVPSGS
jgi:hypothetical protein